MYVNNLEDYGHLIRVEDSSIPIKFLDFYQISKNFVEWQKEYLHKDFWKYLSGELKPEEICPDVYQFHIVTDRFCDDLIHIMENYGLWSNEDDIHMSQVGLHDEWMFFVMNSVALLKKQVFPYVKSEHLTSRIQLVARYRSEMEKLRSYNEPSTYTFSIGLNDYETDYQGGGTFFPRYNCSISNVKKGYLMMHPGRLTHYYEQIPVTNGTKYVAVSLVNE